MATDNNDLRSNAEGETIPRWIVITMLVLLISICVGLIFLIIKFWPGPKQETICNWTLSADQRIIFLVAITGALGSFVHMATSFVDFLGSKKLTKSWLPWYLMRPFLGASLALILYFVIRGGLITNPPGADDSTTPTVNIYGVLAIAGMTGMFSKNAINKLREVFESLFNAKDPGTTDKLNGTNADGTPKK